MTNRHQEFDYRRAEGGSFQIGPPFNSSNLQGGEPGLLVVMDDVVGNRTGANPFSLSIINDEFPFLNGSWPDEPNWFLRFTQFPIGNRAEAISDPRSELGTLADPLLMNQWALEILGKTNPARPHVGVPTALLELRDLPSLVKGYGEKFLRKAGRPDPGSLARSGAAIREAASANLTWKFALAPMIGDIAKLCDFTEAVEKRMRWLKRLRDGDALRTRCSLGRAAYDLDRGMKTIHSTGAIITAAHKTRVTSDMWGSAEWIIQPDSPLLTMNGDEVRSFARHLTAGVTTYGALETAWELTPWSWFLDWFGNVGDIISATNNSIGATFRRICVMRHSKCVEQYDIVPHPDNYWVTFSRPYSRSWERKERQPVYPVAPIPLAKLPYINSGQWSILLSLAALRRR